MTVGAFSLSAAMTTQISRTLVMTFSAGFGIYIGLKKPYFKYFIYWGAPFIIYGISSTIVHYFTGVKGPLLAALFFTIGFYGVNFRYNYIVLGAIPFLILSYVYLLYPAMHLKLDEIRTDDPLTLNYSDPEIKLLNKYGQNTFPDFKGKVILLESWNEYCGVCIRAIYDQQPYLSALKNEFPNFEYYYLHIKPETKHIRKDSTSKFKLIAQKFHIEGLPILFDQNQGFSKQYLEKFVPQFMLYDENGKFITGFNGYNPNLKINFRNNLDRIIRSHFNAVE